VAKQDQRDSAAIQRELSAAPAREATPVGIEGLSKSYGSLVTIIREGRGGFKTALRWNEMLCTATDEAGELPESICGITRAAIESTCSDSKGHPLKFASGDVDQAIMQVAQEDPYHPV